MKAMILAAGRGERMRPLTDTTPKPLLQVGREPLIGWHLRHLAAAGIREIVINHAWLGQQIEDTLGNGTTYGVHITYSAEGGQGLETAGGIATALPLLGSDPFLVINGDILTDIDFSVAVRQSEILLSDGLAYLWLTANPPHNPAGDFSLLSDGLIRSEGSGERLTFSGCGLYKSELRKAMTVGKVRGHCHNGLWLDVGTPERLNEARYLAASW